MKWLKIDPDNLPKGEVLAATFDEFDVYEAGRAHGKMIGNLALNKDGNPVVGYYHICPVCAECECTGKNPYLEMMTCTHYIDILNHDDERE